MSGGKWQYVGDRICDGLEQVASDEAVEARFPRLAGVLRALAEALYEVEHDLDWDLSSDTHIVHDRAWERAALAKLRAATKGEVKR